MSDELTLEPYAARQHWQMPAPLTGDAWRDLLAAYLAALAQACASTGPCVIGHIKLLALFPQGGYLRISAVSSVHRPTCDGQAPAVLDHVSLTLNVLVYGISAGRLQSLARDSALSLAARHGGLVTAEPDDGGGQASPSNRPGNHPHSHAE